MQTRIIRVTVIDDEPTMRRALEDLIVSHARLELVGSGASAPEAVELARRLRPDVVLLDVMLPGGGPAAVEGILECSPQSAVVAISAYADRGTVGRMLAVGAAAYLAKGRSSTVDIVAAIEAAADRH